MEIDGSTSDSHSDQIHPTPEEKALLKHIGQQIAKIRIRIEERNAAMQTIIEDEERWTDRLSGVLTALGRQSESIDETTTAVANLVNEMDTTMNELGTTLTELESAMNTIHKAAIVHTTV